MDKLHKPRTLHLFAGVGGGILGDILLNHQCVCAIEIDNYCQQVLVARQKDGCLPWFPIFDDARTFDGTAWRGIIDILCAGFPCQPFSVAGKREGEDDSRNLWPHTIRIIGEVKPRFCFLENVPGLLYEDKTQGKAPYMWTVTKELSEAGYNCKWDIISAAQTGAPHRRDRLWIVGWNTESEFDGAVTRISEG